MAIVCYIPTMGVLFVRCISDPTSIWGVLVAACVGFLLLCVRFACRQVSGFPAPADLEAAIEAVVSLDAPCVIALARVADAPLSHIPPAAVSVLLAVSIAPLAPPLAPACLPL